MIQVTEQDDPKASPPTPSPATRSPAEPSPRAPMNAAKDSTASSEKAASVKPTRRRHWVRRIVVGLLAFIVLVLVIVQIVLMTDIPRAIVMSAVQQQLGLRAEAQGVHATLFGHTSLTGVKLSLPLADASVVQLPELRVRHTWLPLLILGRPLKIESIELPHPTLYVNQNAAGVWNLAEVAELLGRTGGKEQTASQPASRPELPSIYITDATVVVTDNSSHSATIEHLSVKGEPDPNAKKLVWRYDVSAPGRLSLVGQVVPGGKWEHEVTLDVQNVEAWVKPFVPTFPGLALQAKWTGEAGGGVSGRLQIDRLKVSGFGATGVVRVAQEAGVISVRPEKLSIDTGQKLAPVVTASSGRLTFDGKTAAADGLEVLVTGGTAKVNGQYTLASKAGAVHAAWYGLVTPGAAVGPDAPRHSGTLDATLATLLGGRPDLHATLITQGQLSAQRGWDANLRLEGGGASWASSDWKLTADKLTLTGKQSVPADGLTALASVRGTLLKVESLNVPGKRQVHGYAGYDFATQGWSARVDGSNWPLPLVDDDALAFSIDAAGDPRQIALKDLNIRAADMMVDTYGIYVFDNPRPVDVRVDLRHQAAVDPGRLSPLEQARSEWQKLMDQGPAVAKAPEAHIPVIGASSVPVTQPSGEPPLVSGSLAGSAHVTGTLDPLGLDIGGDLTGKDVWLGARRLGDIKAALKGYAKGQVIDVKTETLKLLGGNWNLQAIYQLNEETSSLTLGVNDLPLTEVRDLMGDARIAGSVDGRFTLYVPGLAAQVGKVRGNGWIKAHDVIAPFVFADTVDARTSLEGGELNIAPIEVRRGPGSVKVGLSANLLKMGHIEVHDLELANWPVPLAEAGMALTVTGGSKEIIVDLPDAKAKDKALQKLRVNTPGVTLSSAITVAQRPAGQVNLALGIQGRVLEIRRIQGTLMGATLYGQAMADFDKPLLVSADVRVDDLKPDRINDFFPGTSRVKGTYGISARVMPAEGPAALEPILLDVTLNADGGSLGQMQIGDARLRAYMNLDPNWGVVRGVLEDEKRIDNPATTKPAPGTPAPPNSIRLAGGLVNFWARVVRNENEAGHVGATSLSSHIRIGLVDLDLDQLIHALDQKANPTIGRVDGNIILYGTSGVRFTAQSGKPSGPGQPAPPPVADADEPQAPLIRRMLNGLYGDGAVKLRDSNLANVSVIAFLYDAMRLGSDMNTATGHGNATFRIESGRADLTSLYYFNRGVEARAQASIGALQDLPDSPLHATAVGSLQPLRNIKIPLIPDIDKLFNAIQAGATSVVVDGTVSKPQMKVILFADIGEGMKNLLMGDVSAATRGSAAQ